MGRNKKIINQTVREFLEQGSVMLDKDVMRPVFRMICMAGPMSYGELLRSLENDKYDWKKAGEHLAMGSEIVENDLVAKVNIMSRIVAKLNQKGLCVTKKIGSEDCIALPSLGKFSPFGSD